MDQSRPGRHRQRRRRPDQRRRPRRLRHEPQLADRLAARLHPERRGGVSAQLAGDPSHRPRSSWTTRTSRPSSRYHNAGGMILRGPGARYREQHLPRRDARGVRRDRRRRRADDPVLPQPRDLPRPVHRPRRLRAGPPKASASSRSPTSCGTTASTFSATWRTRTTDSSGSVATAPVRPDLHALQGVRPSSVRQSPDRRPE